VACVFFFRFVSFRLDEPHQLDNLVWVTNSQGHHVPALWIKNAKARKTLFFSHGNAEDITHCEDWLIQLSRLLRVNVFAFEYPGYSFTTDKHGHEVQPTEALCYDNSFAAYNYITGKDSKMSDKDVVAPKDIIAFGRSLGSGPATHLAANQEVGGP